MLRRPIIQRFSYSPYRKRRRVLYIFAILVILGLYFLPKTLETDLPVAVPVFSGGVDDQETKIFNFLTRWGLIKEPKDILDRGLPLSAFMPDKNRWEQFNLNQSINNWIKLVTRVEPGIVHSILDSQIMALAEAASYEEQAQMLPPPPPEEIPVTVKQRQIPEGKVLVGIYNSHNAETYQVTDGVARLPGKNGGVSEVARTLAQTLQEKYGIGAVYDDTIHDYPRWGASYGNSEETAKTLLKKYPDIAILIDVHRDAGIDRRETVTIENKKAAPVLLIVGTDTRWEHPNWRKNFAFAQKVNAVMNELYPGLSAGVRTQSGRYNQHLHPHAILAEMGSASNSLEEAKVSARLFAKVIARVLISRE